MKRTIYLFAVLLCLAAAMPLFATQRTLVDDVIRMSQAGVGEDAIISFVHNARGRFDVSADDVIAMTNANVSKAVVKAVVDEAAARNNGREGQAYGRSTTVVVAPPYGYGYGYGYYPYSYDPFWYGPSLSLGFGFYGGRGFYGGGWGHGGGHGHFGHGGHH